MQQSTINNTYRYKNRIETYLSYFKWRNEQIKTQKISKKYIIMLKCNFKQF